LRPALKYGAQSEVAKKILGELLHGCFKGLKPYRFLISLKLKGYEQWIFL
jgi:hypothetical protein